MTREFPVVFNSAHKTPQFVFPEQPIVCELCKLDLIILTLSFRILNVCKYELQYLVK